jgi:hypothetical protein
MTPPANWPFRTWNGVVVPKAKPVPFNPSDYPEAPF